MITEPAISFDVAMHARHAPVGNRFSYRLFMLRLPLSRLSSLSVPLLGVNRFNLLAFHERDHGARDGSPLLPWIRDLLGRHGLGAVADGEVVLHTLPRLLGYVFNPVSFWYCYDREGGLRAVLAEVNNTFGGRHNYLVAHPEGRVIDSADVLHARKVFHVSPFMQVRGEYRFRFACRAAWHGVALDYFDGDAKMLTTRLSGQLRPLTARNLLRAWLRCPMLTVGVIARIHWQALRLLCKGVPFFGARPEAPPLAGQTPSPELSNPD